MEAIGTADRVAPIARSPLDSARGRRKYRNPNSTSIADTSKLIILESPTYTKCSK